VATCLLYQPGDRFVPRGDARFVIAMERQRLKQSPLVPTWRPLRASRWRPIRRCEPPLLELRESENHLKGARQPAWMSLVKHRIHHHSFLRITA